jgi:hypothetical protein
MALTSNKDLTALAEEVKALKVKVSNLEAILCEAKILEEADSSWDVVRNKRDYLLSSSDWTMTSGATLDQAQWSAYRQILRDLPQTYANAGPESVKWPKQPSFAGPNTAPVK